MFIDNIPSILEKERLWGLKTEATVFFILLKSNIYAFLQTLGWKFLPFSKVFKFTFPSSPPSIRLYLLYIYIYIYIYIAFVVALLSALHLYT